MARHGLTEPDDAIVETAFTLEGGRAGATRLLDSGITAMIAGNDLMALGAVLASRVRNEPPVSVIGYDGTDMTQLTDPPLTTLRQPFEDMAQLIVDAILSEVDGTCASGPLRVRAPAGRTRHDPLPPPSASTRSGDVSSHGCGSGQTGTMTLDATTPDGPIHACIDRWHAHLRGELDGGLDALLHEDCVFLSPIVFTPQRGREITKLYLRAAGGTLADVDPSGRCLNTASSRAASSRTPRSSARATTRCSSSRPRSMSTAKKYANGVDIITCDDDGRIVEFKVMMRPLQAINAVHAQMKAMLEQLST
jgi:hypothetical protein